MAMDNFSIDVTSKGRESLMLALKIAFEEDNDSTSINRLIPKATHWKIMEIGVKENFGHGEAINKLQALVLFSHVVSDANPFPTGIDYISATATAWNWLQEQDYGKAPQIDGDTSKGFRVLTNFGGHQASHSTICAVVPIWAHHHK